ncbi:MAG TPA: PadR family transcriptional regulator [Solirubrobacterales bacterium]|nr:PadR family transcriptional regulator [Solirubrobacterales bacterium]
MELSPTAHVILGMVRREPRSGYEIKALVDNSTRFFWTASYGQIYPELRRLSETGLLESADAPRGERRRTVYAITEAGESALRDWLREPPQTYEMRDEGLLKLFFAGALPREEAVEIVRSMRERHARLVERLRSIEPKALEKEDPYPLLVLQGGIEFNEWFAGWCERMESQLLEPAATKGATDV